MAGTGGSMTVRALEVLEALDVHGALGVSELARAIGADKGNVSRLVRRLTDEGWLTRIDGKVSLGTRTVLMGRSHPVAQAVREVEEVLHAAAGLTGLTTYLTGLVGPRAVGLVMAGQRPGGPVPLVAPMTVLPLWAGAAGKVIAAQLDPDHLDALLPPEPFEAQVPAAERWFPSLPWKDIAEPFQARPVNACQPGATIHGTTAVRTRRELLAQFDRIRRDGEFLERNELVDGVGCLSVPWTRAGLVGTVGFLGSLATLLERHTELRRVLDVVASPDVRRQDVVAAVAGPVEREAVGERRSVRGE